MQASFVRQSRNLLHLRTYLRSIAAVCNNKVLWYNKAYIRAWKLTYFLIGLILHRNFQLYKAFKFEIYIISCRIQAK